ncbi:hypothetical protein PC129_g3908 [Phytophthora cactorum]|uniref:Phosphatidylinositol-3,4,5-trisphosphate 3-phosphatase n=1 Tax=Phytophthora cactorum TaxID=29920 RepID=A0A329SS47_9STRA|nr:hypothetical protein PC113_g5747 [Phytophthora cactorum]KAG2920647.1 hypothetical protein PC114_g6012 [Phytophthora cactorum]KAG2935166.1 hypothetical protein PC115_g4929 [Phytophthora cactorum]KAG2948890.1 hypothetical protein PC117_g5695 [Phytophthora cactorum]KAG3225504.1 hypothetical protein PC129_g3908 [Phytophthora cactorum]
MNALRAVVSGATVRFVQDGFNLDLTYITPRLIAMSYPASGIEKTYRNDINDVAAFLNSRYPSAYRVYNLSERSYDSSKFEGRVKDYGFPANHPPPLQLLIDIVNDMTEWATKNPRNVVVVHCLDGQGCTGVVCSCYLLLTGHYGSVLRLRSERDFRQLANFSIRDFWNTRGRGVRFPSQALYIYYFIKMLRQLGRTPTQIPTYRPAKKIFLKSIVLHGIPDFDAPPKGGCTPFLQILQAPPQQHQSHLLYNSSWQRTEFETYVADPNGEIVYEVNTEMNDDVLVRCLHAKNMGKQTVTMFHFTFNSDFFDKNSNRFRLPTVELDEVTSDERYPDDFHVICHVEVLDTSGNPFAPISSSSSLTSRTRSSSRPRGDEIEDTRVARLQSAPHRQSFCQPDHEEDGQAQASGWLEKSIPTMQSWLYMQCGLLKNWKKRWVVAREDKMIYYRGSVDATPLGFINLREVTVGKCGAEEVNTQNKCLHFFKVDPHTANQRAYFFGAESEPILEAWSHALGAHYMNEEVTNGNLVDFLSKTKGSDKALTWRLLHDAALGLQFLHQNNIVHGDLKCNQILVSEGLSAKLTDFGMSFVSLESRPATTSGAVRWKAPELLTNEGCTPTFASDIYSFGMCVVEAVSGSVPWRSDLPNIAVIYHLTHGTFLSRPEAFKCDEQWEFVRSLCAFNPSERLGLAAAIEKLDLFARHEQFNAAGG